MEMQYFKDYSPTLGREMECKVYGHAGRPMLYIPCQDGRFFDFENFHMADTLAPWIESGQVMVLSIDTIDKETWSDTNSDPYWRIRRYEQWIRYIVEEAVPKIRHIARERNGWNDEPGVIAFGCSLGATHAVNLYLRFPNIFCGQGDWEQPDTTWYLKRIFEAKHIPIWVDLWGHDVNHDWNWWYQQVAYYMPYILG